MKLREDINKIRDHKADELRSQLSKLRVAYGSLISDPGDEIRSATIETKKGVSPLARSEADQRTTPHQPYVAAVACMR